MFSLNLFFVPDQKNLSWGNVKFHKFKSIECYIKMCSLFEPLFILMCLTWKMNSVEIIFSTPSLSLSCNSVAMQYNCVCSAYFD